MKMTNDLLPGGEKFINVRQLREIVPASNMSYCRWERDPKINFPKRIRLNHGHNFWRLSEIEAWMEKQAAAQAKTDEPEPTAP